MCVTAAQTCIEVDIRLLSQTMCEQREITRLCAMPFTPEEVTIVWDSVLWKAWLSTSGGDHGAPFFHALYAFMTSKRRHRFAAAAMWALAHRLAGATADVGGDDRTRAALTARRCTAVAVACSSLALVDREHAYLLGSEWWPRCPTPLALVSIDDMRKSLAALAAARPTL
jgi:hypothetical protein